MLEYCVSDIGSVTSDNARDLCDLPLLPLRDGSQTAIKLGGTEVLVVPAGREGEDDVMRPVPGMHVDLEGLADGVVKVLKGVAATCQTSLRELGSEVVATRVLPAVLGSESAVKREVVDCREREAEW